MNSTATTTPRKQTRFSFVMVWTSFYEQLTWIPLLIFLATAAGNPETLAFATSAYSTSNMAGNALFGMLSDRVNRMRVAAFGFLAMALTALAHLVISTPAHFIAIRFLHGLAASAVAPAAFASLAAGAPRNRRGEVMARAGLVIALASMVSPALTGLFKENIGLNGTVGMIAGVLALVGFYALRYPSSEDRPNHEQGQDKTAMSAAAPELDASFLDVRLLTLSCGLAFALMFCQNVLFYSFPLKTNALALGAGQTGALLSAFAIGAILAFLPPLSRLSDRFGRRIPLLIGLCIASIGLFGLAPAATRGTIVVTLFCYGLGFGLVFPSLSALNTDAVGPARRGQAFGLLTAMFSAGSVTGPLVTHGLRSVASPFTTGAVVLFIACLAVALVLRKGSAEFST